MTNDPIVKEVREARRRILESYGNDYRAYLAALAERQKTHGERLVSRSPRRIAQQSARADKAAKP